MIIYGVGLLALCTLVGVIVGDLLGVLLGVKSNVGGVGIAMILLICIRLWMEKRGVMTVETEKGVSFWGTMYIPVVVVTELSSGHMALFAAVVSVIVCTLTIAGLSRYNKASPLPKEEDTTLNRIGGKVHG
ncbi:malonate transporter subunit MadL [Citrobacter freundii]|uniref:malonate transporter subunit MadL n=1 Tax=Citrobacter freundii TaxID=546 RepID=UPI0021C781A0|nr:malonate transporter subunit MadL [Citrobacter freundii]MCU0188905.1 malonate transporter subunit MadL [Citrobacter freundii]